MRRALVAARPVVVVLASCRLHAQVVVYDPAVTLRNTRHGRR